MNFTYIFLILFGLVACGTSNEVILVESGAESIESDGKISGTVYVSLKGCPVLIETTIAGEKLRLYPVNLDDAYKTDGIRIYFHYTISRAMQPEGCTLIDRVVAVENVEEIRRK
jgi:hypothetical protein